MIPDIYDQWRRHDADAERWRQARPVCADCGEEIQDETAFCIDGDLICESCINAYRVEVCFFE